VAETALHRFTSCAAPELSGPQENSFKHLAGQVRMDLEPGRTRVHELAETGKPLAAYKLHGTRGGIRSPRRRVFVAGVESFGAIGPLSYRAAGPCARHGWNGPAAGNRQVAGGLVGHKLSAIGSPLRAASSAC